MAIEVKQMMIKSNVLQRDEDKANTGSGETVICQDEPEPIGDSPTQLRQLTEEILRATRER